MFRRIVKLCGGLASSDRRVSGKPGVKPRSRLNLEALETRETPSATSSIVSNFNGTAISAGNDVWFSSVAKVSGLSTTATTTIHVTDQTISFTATVGGTAVPYTVSVPDSTITFDPSLKYATDSFVNGSWVVSSPTKYSGNVFLSGAVLELGSTGLPGGIKNVTWQGSFTSDTAGVSLKWQWAAAVYTSFSSDLSTVGVKASDTATPQYNNSDHAGTPEAFKSFVLGGARGGGGSNYTGSYSSTAAVVPTVETSPALPASLSGAVYIDGVGLGGVAITLNGTDTSGNSVSYTTLTNDDGTYSFSGVVAGSYTVIADLSGYSGFAAFDSIGTVNGIPNGNDVFVGDGQVGGITLASGAVGENYNFYLYSSTQEG